MTLDKSFPFLCLSLPICKMENNSTLFSALSIGECSLLAGELIPLRKLSREQHIDFAKIWVFNYPRGSWSNPDSKIDVLCQEPSGITLQLWSLGTMELSVTKMRFVEASDWAFSVAGPQPWDSIPQEWRKTTDQTASKIKQKPHLFILLSHRSNN